MFLIVAIRLTYAAVPAAGSLIARSPDIPSHGQCVSFSIEGGKFHWLMNSKKAPATLCSGVRRAW